MVEPFLYIPHSKVMLSKAVEGRHRDMHACIYLSINVVGSLVLIPVGIICSSFVLAIRVLQNRFWV